MSDPSGQGQAPDAKRLGEAIRRLRRSHDYTQAQLAKAIGVHKQTVVQYEAGEINIPVGRLQLLAEALGTTAAELLSASSSPRGIYVTYFQDRAPARVAEPNRHRLPPRAYERVYSYLDQMRSAGCEANQIEEAERLMVDGAFNKINKRDPRERSEEDLITDIDAAWDFIRSVLRKEGKRL